MKRISLLALTLLAAACAPGDGEEDINPTCETCDGVAPMPGTAERIAVATCKLETKDELPGVRCTEESDLPYDALFGVRGTPNEFAAPEQLLGEWQPLSKDYKADSDIQLLLQYQLRTIIPDTASPDFVPLQESPIVSAKALEQGITLYSTYSYVPLSFISTNATNVKLDLSYRLKPVTFPWYENSEGVKDRLDSLEFELWTGRSYVKILHDGSNDSIVKATTFTNALNEEVGVFNIPFAITGPMNIFADVFAGLRLEVPEDTKF